jgi:hypothetical protein
VLPVFNAYSFPQLLSFHFILQIESYSVTWCMNFKSLYEAHVTRLQFCINPFDIRTPVTFCSEVFRFDAEYSSEDGWSLFYEGVCGFTHKVISSAYSV